MNEDKDQANNDDVRKKEGNRRVQWEEGEREKAREIVLAISSAQQCIPSEYEQCLDRVGDDFTRGASKFNTDLSRLAEAELYEEIGQHDEDTRTSIVEVIIAPAYWKLRDAFVKDVERGDPHSFARVIWRSYQAGLLSAQREPLRGAPAIED